MSNINPLVIKRLSKELSVLQQNPPEGILIIVNEENLLDIQAWIQGPGTPYAKGSFRIKIQISPGYPNTPPTGFFLTKIFHPNVAENGEICVSTLKKDWKSDVTLSQLLLTIKCLLIVPNPESALNEEAGRLLLEEYDTYAKHAHLMTTIHALKHKIDFPVDKSEREALNPINNNLKRVSNEPGPVKKKSEKKSLKRL